MTTASRTGTLILTVLSLLWVRPGPAVAQVRLAQGVVFRHLEAPRELSANDELRVKVRFTAKGPLDRSYRLFIHAGPPAGDKGRSCRLVANVKLGQRESTEWRAGAKETTVNLGRPDRCGPGPLKIHLGLYAPETGRRLAVFGGDGHFDRIHAATIEVLPEGAEADAAVVAHDPPLEHPPPPPIEVPSLVRALIALMLAMVALVVIQRWPGVPRPRLERGGDPGSSWRSRLLTAAPLVIFISGVLACLGFVKDDAYISFRYAHNLVMGRGMVFNAGERVEGYTNFLWTLIVAPFEAAGADLIQVTDILGPLLGAVLVVLVVRASRRIDGPGPAGSHLWPAIWLASSSSFALWCVGGLEQSLAMLLPFAGALVTWRGWHESSTKLMAAGGLLLAGACLTRPEGHLFVILIGALVLWGAARGWHQGGRRLLVAWSLPILLVLGPYHIWRIAYFGALLPNTYLVKAVSGREVYLAGLRLLEDMLRFNLTGLVIALALLSLAAGGPRVARGFAAVLSVLFMVYVVKVGSDELMWHRLFLPALPFTAVAAGAGLRFLADGVRKLSGRRLRWVPYALGWIAVAAGAWSNLSFTFRETRGLGGYAGCSGMNHPDLGKFLTRHSRPGELVAFQDMGATPYFAPDLRFLDFVGLVDRDVARMLQRYGIHPFVGATRARRGGEFCVAYRDYVFERDPEWVVLVPFPFRGQEERVSQEFHAGDAEEVLRRAGAFRNTQWDCQLYSDPRFRERYEHVRTWQRSPVYYLSTFARSDVRERAGAGVVLEGLPEGVEGPRATFANGAELLGAEIDREEVPERHEVFVTTWWRVPGPRSDDELAFIHLVRRGPPRTRTSLDHPLGDWLWPASRWERGQIVEDRVLVQLPVSLVPGTYDVHVGMFNRRTGDRIEITGGAGEEDHRVHLGTLEVRPMRHLLDPLIPRTDPYP